MDQGAFRPGDAIAWRCHIRVDEARASHLSYVIPMTVVPDTPIEIALFRRPGHIAKRRNAEFGGPRPEARHTVTRWLDGWSDELWRRWRVLILKEPQAEHQISLFWDDAEDRLAFWYIDLVSPVRRREIGFDYDENGLDVVVQPDLSSWRWKDEDEMVWAAEHGLFTAAELDHFRAEGERAVERLYRDRARFEGWVGWRPDPSWPLATLPKGWDTA